MDGTWEQPPSKRRISAIRASVLAALVLALAVGASAVAVTWKAGQTVAASGTQVDPRASSSPTALTAVADGQYPTAVWSVVVDEEAEQPSFAGGSTTTVDSMRDGCRWMRRRSHRGGLRLDDRACARDGLALETLVVVLPTDPPRRVALSCRGVNLLPPVGDTAPVGRCWSKEVTATVRTRHHGVEPVRLRDAALRAHHVHQAFDLAGRHAGSLLIDRWYVVDDLAEVRTDVAALWRDDMKGPPSWASLQTVWSSRQPLTAPAAVREPRRACGHWSGPQTDGAGTSRC